jgi:pantothenate kinase
VDNLSGISMDNIDKSIYVDLRAKELENMLLYRYLRLLEELKILESSIDSSDLSDEDKNKLKGLIEILEERVLVELMNTKDERERVDEILSRSHAPIEEIE